MHPLEVEEIRCVEEQPQVARAVAFAEEKSESQYFVFL